MVTRRDRRFAIDARDQLVEIVRNYCALETLGDAVRIYAKAPWRSRMNVAFSFGDEQLDRAFIEFAGERHMTGLEGHRSIGGVRASLYNAVTEQTATSLCEAIREFVLAQL